ncbi:hypothetical protein [Candidatus Poriferisodalis sp.]|uniref:hypothetical protein n=1 Tax=Candidatus Poriferisodalis sp. TaxID=3101277 RepID=UPI003B0298FE
MSSAGRTCRKLSSSPLTYTITGLDARVDYTVRVAAVRVDDPDTVDGSTVFADTAFADDDGHDRIAETTATVPAS